MPVSIPPPPSVPAAWPRHASLRHGDGLGRTQGRVVVAAICALHGVAGWALLQVPSVRAAVNEVAPVFVSLVAPPAPPEQPPPPPPPAPRPPPKKMPPPPPLVTATRTVAPAPFVASPPPEEPPAPEPPAPPVAVVAPPAPPAPPPPPKLIPPSAVQYLEPPVLEYPRASRRAGESGRVLVRVYIDEAGLPRTVLVGQSSGHARLDAAALDAVRQARFKPYTENARPTAGWALIPLIFDLEP